ncbi:MAG TPA: DUF3649 domain-containing protein [Roseomonas sp.]|nr:DUF3649 domain-containing protein [Roseomonas sp.]
MSALMDAAGRHARLSAGPGARRAGGILLRLLAGVGGGYALAALFAMVFSLALPMPRSEAVLTATMASFAVHAGTIVWAFAARGVLRVWLGLALPGLLLGLALWLLEGRAA